MIVVSRREFLKAGGLAASELLYSQGIASQGSQAAMLQTVASLKRIYVRGSEMVV